MTPCSSRSSTIATPRGSRVSIRRSSGMSGAALEVNSDTRFFGHPRGLATCFFTEMWERFSYYGMRALLILFMTAPVSGGGLAFDIPTAGVVYGLFTAMVYLAAMPGGWLADRIIGSRYAVVA